MKPLQKIIVRAISLTNFLQAAAGLLLISEGIFRVPGRFELTGRHYAVLPYYLMTAVNLGFLLALTVGAVYLWNLSSRGLRICNVVFLCELAYWLLVVHVPYPLASDSHQFGWILRKGLAEAGAAGNIGLSPQILTLYPLIALVLLNISYSRFSHSTRYPASS